MSEVHLKLELAPAGRSLDATINLPDEPIRPLELLPVLLSLSGAVTAMSEAWATDSGGTISCRAGCGACCRQLVPVSELEALHLAQVVSTMPPERRERVTKRFREAGERAAPALEQLHAADGASVATELGAAVAPYFALGIPCPFLEEESCSIHPDRPSICREYLVTSDPAHCARLDGDRVQRVTVPAPVSTALFFFHAGKLREDPRVMPLIDALEWAAAHRDDPQPPFPAAELLQSFMQQITGAQVAQPAPPTITLQFQALGETVSIETEPPPERIRLDEVLPILRVIDDKLIDIATTRSDEPISCTKGCSACCRRPPIPVTPPEAYALLRLVENLDEPRQTEIRSRFADRVARIQAAGLADEFLDRDEPVTKEQARAAVKRYFDLDLVCPFLEDDACSIYNDRPFVCRQYLVTSPKELCWNPLEQPVQPVPMLIAPATAMLSTASELIGRPQFTVPLIFALDYAQAHREELERTYPGEEVFNLSIRTTLSPGGSQ